MAVVGIKLAADLVKEHFGEHVARVAETLLLKGGLQFELLGRAVPGGIGRDLLRQSLGVLVQHNCVYIESAGTAPEPAEGATAREIAAIRDPPSKFHASLPSILQRIRFPKFAQCSKDMFGASGELIADELLANGCQTYQQLVARAVDVSAAVLGSHLENDEARARKRLSRAFRAMAKGNFITKELTCTADEAEGGTARISNLNPNFLLNEEDKNLEGLWRVNYLRYNIHFRNEACAKFVTEAYDEAAGRVIRALFEIAEPFMRAYDEPSSSPVYADAVAEHFAKKAKRRQAKGSAAAADDDEAFQSDDDDMVGGQRPPELSIEAIVKYLDTFSKANPRIVTKGAGEPRTCPYEIDLASISRAMKQRLCESIITQKFGELGARIVRVLLAKKQLEQKKIADIAMIPQKEAREIMYKMITANYIRVQEVPKTAAHLPSMTIFLCYVPYDEVIRLECTEIYKSMHNLKLRTAHHNKTYADLLQRADEASALSREAYDALPESDKRTIEQLQLMEQQIELTVLRMDDSLLVLQTENRAEKPQEAPAKKRKLLS
eukprot:TRINITY_DN18949_c0_g1_i1.p1 TRINITY_DN18949_c0_g1~~TRINITY_DN18949_c0_g1_i1.p1  ORF type:complete len:550 (+),score=174.35 TRINITY_DN18949_c0_g1_i1:485-2134(+)